MSSSRKRTRHLTEIEARAASSLYVAKWAQSLPTDSRLTLGRLTTKELLEVRIELEEAWLAGWREGSIR